MRLKILFLTALALVLAYVFLVIRSSDSQSSVCIRGACVKTEVADDDYSRSVGLMFRKSMEETQGMIFVFDSDEYHSFWMKNTIIPLDMLWINSSNQVVHIEHAVPCRMDPCRLYTPGRKARYVLEVNGGYTMRHGLMAGDDVTIRLRR